MEAPSTSDILEDREELFLGALATEVQKNSSVGLPAVDAGSFWELLLLVSLLLLIVEIDCQHSSCGYQLVPRSKLDIQGPIWMPTLVRSVPIGWIS